MGSSQVRLELQGVSEQAADLGAVRRCLRRLQVLRERLPIASMSSGSFHSLVELRADHLFLDWLESLGSRRLRRTVAAAELVVVVLAEGGRLLLVCEVLRLVFSQALRERLPVATKNALLLLCQRAEVVAQAF